MTILPSRRAFLGVLALGCSCLVAKTSAQDSPPTSPDNRRVIRPAPLNLDGSAGSKAPPPPQPNPWATPIEIDFPGGTLSDFVKKLKPLLPEIDRIEIDRNPEAVLPAVKFRQGQTLQGLLGVLAVMTNGAFQYELGTPSYLGFPALPDEDTKLLLKLGYSPNFIEEHPSQRFIREFDFPGGTVQQLADAIRKKHFGLTNVHVNSSLASLPIPAFRVEKVTFGQMMTIIQQISDGRCQPNLNGTFLEIGYKPDARNTVVTATAIYPLRELLKSYRIEDINALVQTALKMRNSRIGTDEKDPDMSLHNETSTLVVVGSADQVKVVKDVLAALENQPGDTKVPIPSAATNAP